MISDETLDELERLSAQCEPGPWRAVVEGRDAESGDSFIQTGQDEARGEDLYVTRDSGPAGANHLDLIAAARTYLPLLVADLRALRATRYHRRLVSCVVTRHEPYGFYVDLGERQDGVVTITSVADDSPPTPADFPPVGVRIEAVLLGHTDIGDQPRLSTRPSDIAQLKEERGHRPLHAGETLTAEPRLLLPPDFDDYGWEVESKGVFFAAEVEFEDGAFGVTFYDPTRLAQDLEAELGSDAQVSFARVVVVERVTVENMERAVRALDRAFFGQS